MSIDELLYALATDIESLTALQRIGGGAVVSLLTMSIVAMVLVALLIVLKLFKPLFAGAGGASAAPPKVSHTPAPAPAPTPVVQSTAQGGGGADDAELVAVITAAVVAASGGNVNLVVRSISRVSDHGTGWNKLDLGDRI